MHYKEFFLKKKNIINQEIFNKKINWFFDIKSISHNKIKKKYVNTYASQLIADYKKIKKSNYLSKKSTTIKVKPLDKFLKNQVFKPLNMKNTGFYVDEDNWSRIAEPFKDKQPQLIDIRNKPNFFTGGHGLVSTINDYMQFCTMLLKQGKTGDINFLSRKTIEYMTSNHLGSNIKKDTTLYLPGPGYGFGLGFAVREGNGLSTWPGSEGEYFWAGYAGTYFWIDPKEELIVILMTQSVTNRMQFRLLLRNLVYQAIIN